MDKVYEVIIALPSTLFWSKKRSYANLKILSALLGAMNLSLDASKKALVFIFEPLDKLKLNFTEDFSFNGFEDHQNFFSIELVKEDDDDFANFFQITMETHHPDDNILFIVGCKREALVVKQYLQKLSRSERRINFNIDQVDIQIVA